MVDATNVQPEARQAAGRAGARATTSCRSRSCSTCRSGSARSATATGPTATSARTSIRNQARQLRRSLRGLQARGLPPRHVLCARPRRSDAADDRAPAALERPARPSTARSTSSATSTAAPTSSRRCSATLGYAVERRTGAAHAVPPAGRKAVFVGDLVDRGPRILDSAAPRHGAWSRRGAALCVPGNHDDEAAAQAARAATSQITHGLAETLAQLDAGAAGVRAPRWLALPRRPRQPLRARRRQARGRPRRHEGGDAGPRLGQGARLRALRRDDRRDRRVRPAGPLQLGGASIAARRSVVYGHTPVPEPEWLNHTINIDTGCVFGGRLTALRYPERELVSVPARPRPTASRPGRSATPELSAPARRSSEPDDLLDIERRAGQAHHRRPGSARNVTIREENATAALEVMSRFAVNPQLADLPAADDVAVRDEPRARPARASRRRRSRYYRSEGVGRGRLRGEAHGLARGRRSSAATRTRRGAASASPTTRLGHRLHPHRPAASSTTPRSSDALLEPRARGARRAPGCGTSSTTDWLLPRLRADAVVGQGAGAAARPVRRRSARPAGPASPGRRSRRSRRRPRRGVDVAALLAGRSAGAARRRPLRRRLPPLLLAGRLGSTTCGSRRSTCSPPRARVHVDRRPRLAHGDAGRRLCRGRPGAARARHRARRRRRRPTRRAEAAATSPGGRS